MKKIIITTLISLFSISYALAGDEPPTAESNKAAIDMVQTHTDYLWTHGSSIHAIVWGC